MRLDKFLCETTGLTRIQAKRIIGKGGVTVNGVLQKSPATKVTENCEVVYDGRSLKSQGPIYIMLNKPLDTVSTSLEDDYRSVLGILDIETRTPLLIAGRLDMDTTGLLLITDDGKWSHGITSPKKECGKRYRVILAEPIVHDAVDRFAKGVMLRGERDATLPAKLEVLSPLEVLLTIHEGKYHQVKRMFAALNNRGVELHREQVGNIVLDETLELGEWRYLTEQEVDLIK